MQACLWIISCIITTDLWWCRHPSLRPIHMTYSTAIYFLYNQRISLYLRIARINEDVLIIALLLFNYVTHYWLLILHLEHNRIVGVFEMLIWKVTWLSLPGCLNLLVRLWSQLHFACILLRSVFNRCQVLGCACGKWSLIGESPCSLNRSFNHDTWLRELVLIVFLDLDIDILLF